MDPPRVLYRLPVMALAMISLVAALLAGLARLGWPLPVLSVEQTMAHGPLMVCGFLGTLISLERAVALGRPWAYLAPLLTGVGGFALLAGWGAWSGPLLLTAGSALLVAVFATVLRVQRDAFIQVMALGALAWLVGNIRWLAGAAVFEIVYVWMGFLVLTIAGERLELSRVLLHVPRVQRYFLGLIALLAVSLLVPAFAYDAGVRLTGAVLVGLAVWLLRYDVARRTVRQSGLTRFIAVCLLSGYGWLLVGGVLMLVYGGAPAGPVYDAVLHAVFVGFVFSMIFAHAPMVFPSILGREVVYRSFFYGHLGLLQLSLALRTLGDLAGVLWMRRWGGLLNGGAIVLFLAATAYTVVRSQQKRRGALFN